MIAITVLFWSLCIVIGIERRILHQRLNKVENALFELKQGIKVKHKEGP